MNISKKSLKFLTNQFQKQLQNTQKQQFSDYLKELDKRFGEVPEENLLQKALKGPFTQQLKQKQQEEIKKLKQELDIKVDYKKEIGFTEKKENYPIQQQQYINYRKENPYGKVNIIHYNDTQYTLIGTQYQFLPIKNIYKLLKASKPEIICLQIRPDQILKDFVVNIKKPDSEYFSTSRYFRQILKKGYEIMPSNLYRKKVQSELLLNNIYLKRISDTNEEFYKEYSEQIKKQYKPYTHNDRLSMDTIATACFYAERNDIPIILCDLPEIIHRQDIANSHTLMQLQNMLTRSSRQIALEPDLKPHTPLSVAYSLFPEEFLQKSDQYMASIFQYLNNYDVKRVTALVGNTQSASLDEIMTYREENEIVDHLVPQNVQHSLIRDVTAEEIVEKHSILDVMNYGQDILQNFENYEFQTTYEMIQRYGDPMHVDKSNLDKLRYMHYNFIKKYQKFTQQEYKDGQKLLKREFLKKVGY